MMNIYPEFQLNNYLVEKEERKGIRRLSSLSAIGVMGYLAVSTVMSFPLLFPTLGNLYANDPSFQSAVTIFLSVFSLLIPFGLCGIYAEKKTGTDAFRFDKPVSAALMITAVFLGFFICLSGNYVTSIFVTLADTAGVKLTSPEYVTPMDLPGRLIYAVAIAVVPALVEEFAIRGAVMQPLRKYGDWFAIIASSIVFAVLHGNLIQAPFALIAGIGIGYAVCITESMWTGVIIHFLNNLYSVATEFMIADIPDEERLNKVYYITMGVLYAVSVAGSVVFVIIRKNRKLKKASTALTAGRKFAAFMLSVPMIISLIIMLALTTQFVEIEWFK